MKHIQILTLLAVQSFVFNTFFGSRAANFQLFNSLPSSEKIPVDAAGLIRPILSHQRPSYSLI